MTPPPSDKSDAEYFAFIPGQNNRGPLMKVESRPKGKSLFGAMPLLAKILADNNNNVIIDEVLFGNERLDSYITELSDHVVYFVGVYCDIATMQEREILRQDRAIGLSYDQVDRVHEGKRNYDIRVDTTRNSMFESAQKILVFIKDTPRPNSFL
jgi:chloramphenicol 3-O phosphotransferase